MPKTVLVVDDSRVALASLARLLRAHGLMVDTVESGPEALDYLRLNPPPAVIFLDHMMPGMDGFETLKVLKAAEATAAIPVVMYTSKDDANYIERARALGAADVLQKPAHAVSINRMVGTFQLLRDREAAARPAAMTVPRAADGTTTVAVPRPVAVLPPSQVTAQTAPGAASEPSAERHRSRGKYVGWALALLLLATASWWSYLQYREIESVRAQLLAENARLEAADLRRVAAERATAAAQTPAAETRPADAGQNDSGRTTLLDTLAWALNQNGRYDFGEIPFNDARLQQLRDLIARLGEAGFRGTVRLDGHLGEFCVVRDEQGGNRLPPPGTLFSGCEVLTYPPGEAVRLAQRQSEAFARFLGEQTAAHGPIEVIIVSHGASRPLQHYPDRAATAAEWNAVARANQRIEIGLVPATR